MYTFQWIGLDFCVLCRLEIFFPELEGRTTTVSFLRNNRKQPLNAEATGDIKRSAGGVSVTSS